MFGTGNVDPTLSNERPPLDSRYSEKTDIEALPPAETKGEPVDSDTASSIEQGIGVTKIEALCELGPLT